MGIHRNTLLALDGPWRFCYTREAPPQARGLADLETAGLSLRPCVVPGNFELDLHALGILPDPFVGMNAAGLRDWESTHVWYGRTFDGPQVPAGSRAELLLEGVDCFAEVFLNGRQVGSCGNMLIEHAFDVTDFLASQNEILVHIRPAAQEAATHDYPAALFAQPSTFESLYVRKAPHMWGWDIMPRIVSAGLWRSVSIRAVSREGISALFLRTPHVSEDRRHARLAVDYRLRRLPAPRDRYELAVEGRCGTSVFSHRCAVLFDAGISTFELADPMLWWPRPLSPAALYDVTARLLKNGREIDALSFRHGIRTVTLDRTPVTDDQGHGEFCFRINGRKMFILGSNWVPADAFHSRDRERLPALLRLVDEVGCNLLRCWGGNVYESDAFFDWCDEHGVMVWQDFAMACGCYPRDAGFQAVLDAEARAVVRRLRSHASLVLWAGDNECDLAVEWSGRQTDPNDNVLTRHTLPSVLDAEDGTRPYLPSSPYISPEACAGKARGARLPEDHLWGPRGYFKDAFYRNPACHFASEIGYHGCPSPASVRRFISPERVWPFTDNPEWLLHSTSPIPGVNLYDYRVELMANQVRKFFGQVPDTLEGFAFASQATQAEAVKFFIEHFRGTQWRRTGLIWWNLVDGWPQFSDAVVDYYGVKKLAFHVIRRSQQPVCLFFDEPRDGRLVLLGVNDTDHGAGVEWRVRSLAADRIIQEGSSRLPSAQATALAQVPIEGDRQDLLAIEWQQGRISGRNHYLQGTPPFDADRYRAWMDQGGFLALEGF